MTLTLSGDAVSDAAHHIVRDTVCVTIQIDDIIIIFHLPVIAREVIVKQIVLIRELDRPG